MEKRTESDEMRYKDKIERLKSILGDEVSVDIELLQARVIDELYDDYIRKSQCENNLKKAEAKRGLRAETPVLNEYIFAQDQKAKADYGKEELTLVPRRIIHDICAIRMYGNRKYPEGGPDNWKQVEIERYRNAAYRHFLAYIDDPQGKDEESGFPHLWHLACNIAFLCEKEDQK